MPFPPLAARLLWILSVPVVLTACAGSPPTSVPGPEIAIPGFATDDPRVGTAGFVARTLRLHHEVDGGRYTLMAFVVGDTLTLGAMTKGVPFAGTVHWQIGAHDVAMAFDAAQPGATTQAIVDEGRGQPLAADGAAFQGTAWINVELPRTEWLPDGTALALEFRPTTGGPIALPAAGTHYVARVAAPE